MKVLATAIRQEKEMKGLKSTEEEVSTHKWNGLLRIDPAEIEKQRAFIYPFLPPICP